MSDTTIAAAKYVSLVTFRRSGEPVASPVWIAPLADGRAGFTTNADSGKVKRIRNNPAVELRPCNVRGAVDDNAPTVAATATVVTGSLHDTVHTAIHNKYGVMVTLIGIGDAFRKLSGKRQTPTAIVLSFAESRTGPSK
ncbi:MAG: PPOX class F420-dependent oxidoreductase [Actinobacteria bacterium]|nr:PPOX class F420-dependent oxidoreductase [Actinomycetota bacterium]